MLVIAPKNEVDYKYVELCVHSSTMRLCTCVKKDLISCLLPLFHLSLFPLADEQQRGATLSSELSFLSSQQL